MARHVRDSRLDSRDARKRLQVRDEPHWRALDQGQHLGYRRRRQGGSWIARRRKATWDGTGSPYDECKLGLADDFQDGDGVTILSYREAQEKARHWFATEARREAGHEPASAGPYTVKNAMRDYLAWYGKRGRATAATGAAIHAHIDPALGDIELGRLTTRTLRKWLEDLAASGARVRSRRGADKPKHRPKPTDADAVRRRRATANRVLHILKAALNHAWHEGHSATDEAWRKVKPFRDVDAPVVRYLKETECARLVNACPAEFRPLVRAALLTGCRYGEITALRVSDFNEDAGTLAIRISKSGKVRHVVLTDEGQRFFAAATAGKPSDALIFIRADGEPWGKSQQQRPLAEACRKAKITPAIGFHVLRHTHGSTLAMKGVPLPVIAKQLGHADTRMTEKHYAHLAPSYVADTIRANFPELGIVPADNVKRMRPNRRG